MEERAMALGNFWTTRSRGTTGKRWLATATRWRAPAIRLAGLLAGLLLLPGPAAAQQAGARPPIKVGAISSAALFPEATVAVKAYFDAVNANGGIQGRRLVLLAEDDRADPALAAQAARRLNAEQVVAHVGSASAMECAVNAALYAELGLVSIQGIGVDPVCFGSPNIAPVNAGPYAGTALGLQFLATVRRWKRLCAVAVAYAPVQKPAFEREVAQWSAAAGLQLGYSALGIPPDADLGAHLEGIRRAGCQAVVFTAVAPHVTAWMREAQARQLPGIEWVFLTPAYTAEMAGTLPGGVGNVYVMSEFEPWSSRSGMLTDWRFLMVGAGVPLTSLSQGGYAAANVFVKVLRGIRGDITRAAVTQAFKQMQQPLNVPLLGTPFKFGPGPAHNPNRAAVPMQLVGGRWSVAHWDYIVAPESRAP
jgi:branched-chain amino acid transport system substrate-binding protein